MIALGRIRRHSDGHQYHRSRCLDASAWRRHDRRAETKGSAGQGREGLMLAYAYLWEAFGPLYGSDVAERTQFFDRLFGLYAPAYWPTIALNVLIPQLLWLPAVRRREVPLFLISAGIIVGMWLERFVIVIPALHRNYMPSYWGTFTPTIWDWATLAGSIGLFLALFFLMLRLLPIVSMAEVREIVEKERAK